MENVIKGEVATTNWDHRAFLKVCAKACYVTERIEKDGVNVNVFLDGGDEYGYIVGIEGSSHDGTLTTNLVKQPLPSCQIEYFRRTVDGDDKK